MKKKIKLNKDFISIREKIKRDYLNLGFTISGTESLKAIKNNSWILFRESKTEDKILRIIVDSRDEKTAEEFLKEAEKMLNMAVLNQNL